MKAIEIIRRSMRLIGSLGVGEAPSADESSDCLIALNQLIASWNVDALTIYSELEENFTLLSGQASYSWGVGGDFDGERPDKLLRAYITYDQGDYEIAVVNDAVYQSIVDKSNSAIPNLCYYNPSYPLGTFYIYPVPNQDMPVRLSVYSKIKELASISDEIMAPPQYMRALSYNLAMEIAPEFGMPVSPDIVNSAKESLAAVKRINTRTIIAQTEVFAMTEIAANRFNIQGG